MRDTAEVLFFSWIFTIRKQITLDCRLMFVGAGNALLFPEIGLFRVFPFSLSETFQQAPNTSAKHLRGA